MLEIPPITKFLKLWGYSYDREIQRQCSTTTSSLIRLGKNTLSTFFKKRSILLQRLRCGRKLEVIGLAPGKKNCSNLVFTRVPTVHGQITERINASMRNCVGNA
jgi:hypothetical protein